MSLRCAVGMHEWVGCTCARCGKERDEGHDWSQDCEKCAKCHATRHEAHAWSEDMKRCSVCGMRWTPKAGDVKTVDIGGRVTMEFVWCPATVSEEWMVASAGQDYFVMGSPSHEKGHLGDETQHKVTLTNGFWLGRTEVTQMQWIQIMHANPSKYEGPYRPVEQVSWDDCQKFISKLNRNTGCAARRRESFRLPTEAEWEYACRAGTSSALHNGKELIELGQCTNLHEIAWHCDIRGGYTQPVGLKNPNRWGLHDMSGNVWEWCQDWYGQYSGDATDPSGAESGSERVRRGGSWVENAQYCRSAHRDKSAPSLRGLHFGLRIASSDLEWSVGNCDCAAAKHIRRTSA